MAQVQTRPLHTASNELTLTIHLQDPTHHLNYTSPQQLLFSSFTEMSAGNGMVYTVTNATCQLTTSYVEAETLCHGPQCSVQRNRSSTEQHDAITRTVLDASCRSLSLVTEGFLRSFVNSTNTPWTYKFGTKLYSTAIGYYFTDPDAPYFPP